MILSIRDHRAERELLDAIDERDRQIVRLKLRLLVSRARAVYAFLVDRERSTAQAFRALADAGLGGNSGTRAALTRRAWVTNQKLVRVGRILTEAMKSLEANK